MKASKIIARIIASPFVFLITEIALTRFAIVRTILFLRYGGEFVNREKGDDVTMKMLYDELKKANDNKQVAALDRLYELAKRDADSEI